MDIITTTTGDRIDMKTQTGDKDSVVAVFKSSNDYFVHAPMHALIEGGTPIEYEGDDEGEDMEYLGLGFVL